MRTSVFLECASNSVPKVGMIKKFIDLLKSMGYDALYLGTADTYEIEGEPYFGYNRGRYSLAELKELDGYAAERGLQLIPALQTLAHLDFLPQYVDYADIIDISNILLVGEEKTYALIDKMFASVREASSGSVVHIGMDEAFLLGLGKYMHKHGYTDRTKIMLSHLEKVIAIAAKYGFTCEMWSDMFFRLINDGEYDLADCKMTDDLKVLIPQGLKLDYWNYGNVGYERLSNAVAQHKKLTDNLCFAGGIIKWMGFAPDNEYSMQALTVSRKVCEDYGVNDYMVTLWADNGGEASWFSTLPGLYFYAQYLQGKAKSLTDFDKEGFRRLTGVAFDDFMLVDKINKPRAGATYKTLNNKCFFYLYNDVFLGDMDSLLSEGIGIRFADVAREIGAVKGGEYGYIFESLSALAKVLSVKAELGKNVRKAYAAGDKAELRWIAEKTIPELLSNLALFFEKFSVAWHKENKSYGFEAQCVRLGGLRQRLEFVRGVLKDYANGKIDKIEQLEGEQLPFNYTNWSDELSEDDLVFSGYRQIALDCVL